MPRGWLRNPDQLRRPTGLASPAYISSLSWRTASERHRSRSSQLKWSKRRSVASATCQLWAATFSSFSPIGECCFNAFLFPKAVIEIPSNLLESKSFQERENICRNIGALGSGRSNLQARRQTISRAASLYFAQRLRTDSASLGARSPMANLPSSRYAEALCHLGRASPDKLRSLSTAKARRHCARHNSPRSL